MIIDSVVRNWNVKRRAHNQRYQYLPRKGLHSDKFELLTFDMIELSANCIFWLIKECILNKKASDIEEMNFFQIHN